MNRFAAIFAFSIFTASLAAEVPVGRVADDAHVVDRVAEASKRDLPHNLLRRIVNEDIELLRGKKPDGMFQFATYERMEASRVSESASIEPRADDETLTKIEARADFAYRVLIEVPNRRLLVTKNKHVFLDRLEIEYIPQGASGTKVESIPIKAWLDAGTSKTIDLADIGRQATARLFARADREAGYSNVSLTLIQARIFDNADSPYADAVESAKAILRGIDHDDLGSIRSMASRMHDRLAGMRSVPSNASPAAPAPALAPPVAATLPARAASESPVATPARETAGSPDLFGELQAVEDLLTGSESEKRDGLNMLHQLVRKLRPQH